MKRNIILALLLPLLFSCNTKQKQVKQAQIRINKAIELIANNQNNVAKLQLDSVHLLYPNCIEQRRIAKNLMDSIVYIEAKQTLHYSDSLLQPLLPLIDKIIKNFKYEKQSEYENNGRYVHKLLPTNSNLSRCFLQAYVTDDFRTILKSYYYGSSIGHNQITISAGNNQISLSGTTHSFSDDRQTYEILTINQQDAISALHFIANNYTERIKVTLHGTRDYIYYLNDNEKHALEQTCQLAVLFNDVHRLEEQINQSNAKILKYQSKQ